MDRRTHRGAGGFAVIEIVCVVGVMVLLLALGFTTYRSLRLAARVSVAQSDLKQIGTALELYFREYGSYPPQGCDLAATLAPLVESPEVFNNPLTLEETPGQTISELYRAPTSDELDRPNIYLTAMVGDDGRTSVVLRTGQSVERHDDILFNPNDPSDFHASLCSSADSPLAPPDDGIDGGGETGATDGSGGTGFPDTPPPPPPAGQSVGGSLNINPNNNSQSEFSMSVPDGAGGVRVITRDDLHDDFHGTYYAGPATQIRVCPKGNGNQNGLFVDGSRFSVRNGTLYLINVIAQNTGSSLFVRLYNDGKSGKAMGHWWIDIIAAHVTITTGL